MSTGTTISIIIGVGLLAAGAIAWALWPAGGGPEGGPSGQTRQDDGAGGVTFKATLAADQSSDSELVFAVVLDTHTIDLARYDPLQNVVLRTDDGPDTSAATSSSRSSSSTSHHVEATLRFPFDGDGKVRLVAKALGGVPERVLEFDA